jgi:carbamoyltransferase
MRIMGVSVDIAISSACLVENGVVISAISEERLSRKKVDSAYPSRSIKRILEVNNLSIEDIDHIVIPWNPKIHLNYASNRFVNSNKWRGEMIASLLGNHINNFDMQSDSELICQFDDTKITFINHHDAHFANAYYLSGFKDAIVLTIDGKGESDSTIIQYVKNGKRENVSEISFPHSLGMFYAAFTNFLGFKPEVDEWKVMAIGAINHKKKLDNPYIDKIKNIIKLTNTGYELDLKLFDFYLFDKKKNFFNEKLEQLLGIKSMPKEPIRDEHILIAEAVQNVVENTIDHLIKIAYKASNLNNLCLGGGVAMNSLYNGKIVNRHEYINDVFISSCPDDSGVAVGAALFKSYEENSINNKSRKRQVDNYWGTEYSNNEIKNILDSYKINYTYLEDDKLFSKVAHLINDEMIIGWFQGKMEFGQRALGNRSIIATPTGDKIKDLINRAVKFREGFRPFAPAILEEYAKEYFEFPDDEHVFFMEKVYQFKDKYQKKFPAIVHYDGTGRLQSVNKKINPRFYRLIESFNELTGVPIVVNTSFNLNGEPIVESPIDAIKTFYVCGLDYLVIGNYLISKS